MKDRKKTKRNNSRLYNRTCKYYTRYRPDIPKKVIDIIVKHLDVKPTDRVLDIGCGTGKVALAMEDRCDEMVCLDPDSEMLRWAKKATKSSKTRLTWINRSAEDLGKLQKGLGTFKLATSSRAFHWMNQEQVLKNLDELIDENGGIAIFSDRVLWGGGEEWQRAVKKVIQKYLRGKRSAGKGKSKKSDEPWENVLARSVFRFIKTYDVPIVRTWDIESIIGYVLSTAFAAPHLFGNQLDRFKKEVKETLLSLNPEGVFKENAAWSIVLGSKKPYQ